MKFVCSVLGWYPTVVYFSFDETRRTTDRLAGDGIYTDILIEYQPPRGGCYATFKFCAITNRYTENR